MALFFEVLNRVII